MAIHDVYRNLTKSCLSLLHVGGDQAGRIAGHVEAVLLRDASFRVRSGGQARARAERKRNVHAFCRGAVITDPEVVAAAKSNPAARRIRYNPFCNDTFVTDDGVPAVTADQVVIDASGMWGIGIRDCGNIDQRFP